MKPRRSNQRNRALTLTEVLVVVVVLAVLAAVILPALLAPRRPFQLAGNCTLNLKQINLAFLMWANDNNGKYPMEISTANGGTKEMAATGDVVSTFRTMTNELNTPWILFCPAGPIHNFSGINWENFTTKKVNYFIGLDANTNRSQAILTGDDNFAIGGVPEKSGLLKISTNAPISWTAARHKFVGNIGLADGSVQQVTTNGLRQLLQQTGLATNRLAIP
jgi:prepilin-type N-terminal cleavage/methylation domain-containing protein